MVDKVLHCKECDKDFVFSVAEQEAFHEKGLFHDPSRCFECRQARKARRNAAGYGRTINRLDRETYEAVCAECGCTTQVPFRPREDRPVYCRQCYIQKKQQGN